MKRVIAISVLITLIGCTAPSARPSGIRAGEAPHDVLPHDPAASSTTAPAEFNATDFNALSKAGKLDFVLTVLDARDGQLENVRYEVREDCNNVSLHGGSRRFMRRADYEFRRMTQRLWMHLTDYGFGSQDDKRNEGVMNWNGQTAINLEMPPFSGSSHHRATIQAAENDNFTYRRINELLGFRVQFARDQLPIADLLRKSISFGYNVDSDTEKLEDSVAIKVTIRPQSGRDLWIFWLLPDMGYMIKRFDYKYGSNGGYNRNSEVVLVPQEVSGIWVPKRATSIVETSAFGERSEFTYEFLSFSIGNVQPKDLDIEFPNETRVTDLVNRIAYDVLPDGKRRLLPFADTQGGVFRVPPPDSVVAVDGADAAKLYRERNIGPQN